MSEEKHTTVPVPAGAKNVIVKINGPHYPVILEFDDSRNVYHYWLKDGKYDGHCGKGCNDKCGGVAP